MTTYSEYGYTVSASTDAYATTGFYPWKVFNDVQGNEGWHAGEYNDGSSWYTTYAANAGGAVYDTANWSRSIGGIDGEWLKLEMPHRLVVDYVTLKARLVGQSPKDFKIIGSNDDVNWDIVSTHTGVTASTTGETHVVSATKAYKYLAIVITRVQGTDNQFVSIGELSYHGHKENDTTRFPVSSTVLKYPHIQNTGGGDAIRGYVFSSSGGSASTPGFAFDGSYNAIGGNWLSSSGTFSSGVALSTETFGGSGSTINGPWLKVEMTNKILPTKLNMFVRESTNNNPRQPRSGIIYGSVDNSSWTNIGSFSYTNQTLPGDSTPNEITLTPSPSGTYYKYFLLHVTQMMTAKGLSDRVSITGMEFYGTEPEDVIARVGEGLDGKVANFRVYDKYLHEEQALELWDAQKDQFGRATSSVVVHRGRLGVGTTEPEGRFAVLDEPGDMEEFPPRPMSGYETHMEGHGVFRVITDNPSGSNAGFELWRAFDKSDVNGWTITGDFTSGVYTGSTSLGSHTGRPAILHMPYAITLKRIRIQPRNSVTSRFPADYKILGSNDNGSTWTLLATFVGKTYTDEYQDIDSDTPFSSYALVISKLNDASNGDRIIFGEWRLFGTRQGQSTLHDGELKLTKNLTVPRIGPPLDADDTPQRDRLVVEYNTSTNPTENGMVRDTSGRGNDGFMVGSSYSATDKSLSLTNSPSETASAATSYITRQSLGNKESGNFHHSVSLWFKMTTGLNSAYRAIFEIGPNPRVNGKDIALYVTSNSASPFAFASGGNSLLSSGSASAGRVYHIVVVYDGSKKYIYIDGVLNNSADFTSFNGVQNMTMQIGRNNHANANEGIDGSISNFKMYVGHALTADEVKRLYDMGRCDEGHHAVNFSKTRVGIGLGDGEAPRGALDVRGEASFIGPGLVIHQGGTGNWAGAEGDPGTMNGLFLTREGETGITTGSSYWNISTQSTGNSSLLFSHRGKSAAYIQHGNNNNPLDFTGQHRTFIKDVPFSQAGDLEGLIVSSDQNKYIKMSGDIETGSNAIMINESLPIVSLSTTINDKKCFGVISASEDPEQRSVAYGSFVTPFEKEKGDTRVFINSVGEGAMWVTDTNGPLESGDYITTSNVAGYGQKQDSEFLANYTVAKITMDCDFNPQDQPIQRIKQSNVVETHYTGMVSVTRGVPHEFVTTTVTADDEWSNVSISPSDVTYEEWSNLEANVQNTYTLTYTQTSNVVYDVKYTKTTTANVTQSDPWDNVYVDPPNVSYEEWSNLDASVQNTYTLTYTMTTKVEATEAIYSNLSTEDKELFVPTYYQMVEQRVDAEYPGAVKHETVTDRLENALDEHGQLQWEDHPTETEKAYKIRYLDASGAQTDEANAVHTAAFVGVTYHCG
jgi:hypothetical protein